MLAQLMQTAVTVLLNQEPVKQNTEAQSTEAQRSRAAYMLILPVDAHSTHYPTQYCAHAGMRGHV